MNKKVLEIVLISLVVVGGVGAAAYFTKGFKDFSAFTDEIQDTKDKEKTVRNFRSFDFVTDQSGSLTESTLVSFVNNRNREQKQIFESVSEKVMPGEEEASPCIAYTFADKELGLRIGTNSNLGYFALTCIDDYKYDHLKIQAVNYHRKTGENTYEKEVNGSEIAINGYRIDLKANSSLEKADAFVTKTISFAELKSELIISAFKGRPCLLKLELWSE